MSSHSRIRRGVLAACLFAGAIGTQGAWAQQAPIKIGLIAPFSGPFADYGKLMEGGMKAWLKQNGDSVAGHKIEIVVRDTTGPQPEIAKRLAQELVVRDKVDFLAGFGLTPEALAVAPIAEQAKKPMIVMNAASTSVTSKSKYIARVSMTLPQISAPMATWAAKNGIKRVVVLVADYAPGADSAAGFTNAFKAAGGEVIDTIRTPLMNPEFAPYLQRIKDLKPDAVFVFVPAGEQSIAVMKGFRERGLADAGIKLICTGDITDDHVLAAMGDAALGVISAFHYSAANPSPENKAFLKAFAEANGAQAGRPNFMAVGGYDGMAAMAEVIKRLNGKIDGDKAMAVLAGLKLDSPRGPVTIDAITRDPTQTVYIHRVEKVDGQPYNIVIDKFPDAKDPTR